MSEIKILVFSGSTRNGSTNHQLGASIVKQLKLQGADANLLSLKNYPMPIYDQDLESKGIPKAVIEFAAQIADHDGLVITSPEYNASLSPLLKNALDWLSRIDEINGLSVTPIKAKPVAIAAASPGSHGGIRGLSHLRDVLVNLGALILSEQLAVGNTASAFHEDGSLTNERAALICQNMCKSLIQYAKCSKAK